MRINLFFYEKFISRLYFNRNSIELKSKKLEKYELNIKVVLWMYFFNKTLLSENFHSTNNINKVYINFYTLIIYCVYFLFHISNYKFFNDFLQSKFVIKISILNFF